MDINQIAKTILDEAIREAPKVQESAKVIATRNSGHKGGTARAASLTPQKRAEIARLAAAARWNKNG